MTRRDTEITLTAAAQRISLSYHQTLRLVLTGGLRGVQRDGHWYVRAADLARYLGRTALVGGNRKDLREAVHVLLRGRQLFDQNLGQRRAMAIRLWEEGDD